MAARPETGHRSSFQVQPTGCVERGGLDSVVYDGATELSYHVSRTTGGGFSVRDEYCERVGVNCAQQRHVHGDAAARHWCWPAPAHPRRLPVVCTAEHPGSCETRRTRANYQGAISVLIRHRG
jgi:hypothetical protein